jgi:hypothetical protein
MKFQKHAFHLKDGISDRHWIIDISYNVEVLLGFIVGRMSELDLFVQPTFKMYDVFDKLHTIR